MRVAPKSCWLLVLSGCMPAICARSLLGSYAPQGTKLEQLCQLCALPDDRMQLGINYRYIYLVYMSVFVLRK